MRSIWSSSATFAVTKAHQRCLREVKGRRGRRSDASWANRRLLLRAGNTLSPRALRRLKRTYAVDDSTGELAAAWGVKEQLRRLLACGSLADAHTEKMRRRSPGSALSFTGHRRPSLRGVFERAGYSGWNPGNPPRHLCMIGRDVSTA